MNMQTELKNRHNALDRCLQKLKPKDRLFVLTRYERGHGVQYVDLGTEFGISAANGESSLHVFDGAVEASTSQPSRTDSVLAKASSSLHSQIPGSSFESRGIADTVPFDWLRQSLADGSLVENFSENPLPVNGEKKLGWEISDSNATSYVVSSDSDRPLLKGLGKSLKLRVVGDPKDDDPKLYSSLLVSYNFESENQIDLEEAHTIECVIRLDCPVENLRDLIMFGGQDVAWQRRAWQISAVPVGDDRMWQIYNSRNSSSEKFQYLKLFEGKTYHLFVEIDPKIGRYRKTISDGEQSVWSQSSNGSPVKLKESGGSLGPLHWRIRGLPGKEVAFSIDAVRIRNRPVLTTPKAP